MTGSLMVDKSNSNQSLLSNGAATSNSGGQQAQKQPIAHKISLSQTPGQQAINHKRAKSQSKKTKSKISLVISQPGTSNSFQKSTQQSINSNLISNNILPQPAIINGGLT